MRLFSAAVWKNDGRCLTNCIFHDNIHLIKREDRKQVGLLTILREPSVGARREIAQNEYIPRAAH